MEIKPKKITVPERTPSLIERQAQAYNAANHRPHLTQYRQFKRSVK